MEKVKKGFIILLGIPLTLILSQCTKYKEKAPFFEGLILEYGSSGATYGRYIYEINSLDDNGFKITKKEKWKALKPKPVVMMVKANGRVYESNKKRYKNKFSPIWIPVNEMEIGDKFDDRNIVERKAKWEKWKVLVVKDTPTGGESYYDLNTGYWVGSFARTAVGSGEIVLVDTNADIPTVEE